MSLGYWGLQEPDLTLSDNISAFLLWKGLVPTLQDPMQVRDTVCKAQGPSTAGGHSFIHQICVESPPLRGACTVVGINKTPCPHGAYRLVGKTGSKQGK